MLWQKYQTTNLLNALQIEILKLFGTDEDPETDRLDLRMEKGLSILSSLPLFVFSVYSNQKITAYPLPAGGLQKTFSGWRGIINPTLSRKPELWMFY